LQGLKDNGNEEGWVQGKVDKASTTDRKKRSVSGPQDLDLAKALDRNYSIILKRKQLERKRHNNG
jgi:hypothetical protein